MIARRILDGVLVTELGGREGVATCGLLLAQLGATVIVVEPSGVKRMRDGSRAQFCAGKLSMSVDLSSADDRDLLADLATRSNVIVTSSDVDDQRLLDEAAKANGIVCDITAFGLSGPRAGEPLSEIRMQAVTGLMDTTGEADGPPVAIGVPIVGYVSGTYAAAAVLAALRVKRLQGISQRVEISMFECAFLTLNAFLSAVLIGKAGNRSRMGNRHPTVAPWNAYETTDGWVLICVGNDQQWSRLYDVLGKPGDASKFETQAARIANVEELDQLITAWSRHLSTEECTRQMLAIDVPAGPIAPIDQYPREANIDFRGMIRKAFDPVLGRDIFLPASPLKLTGSEITQPERIPAPGADRAAIIGLLAGRQPIAATKPASPLERPLAGLRVIELGQYTSAPLCARHLAHLGAEVIKIEQPGGDVQRSWVPHIAGKSATFRLNNTDKRSMVIDLRSEDGRETLMTLLKTADVVVENMKPGTLSRYGFSPEEINAINPRLVYCDITGFGSNSLYNTRPAFDMVVQAMSGFMTAVRPNGMPLKSGISAADMMVAEMGIVGVLAALEERDLTGHGQHYDLSMQDVSCWVTAPSWNVDLKTIARPTMLACSDGFVVVDADRATVERALDVFRHSESELSDRTRLEVASIFETTGLPAVPVCTIRETAEAPQTREYGTWFVIPEDGLDWPVLACPLRLQLTPPIVRTLIPDTDHDGVSIRAELGLSPT